MPRYIMARGPSEAKIMIVGEAPGPDEITGPFQGRSGQELGRMLNDAGILESECFITNVLRFQPPSGYWKDKEWVSSQKQEHRFNEEFYATTKKGIGQSQGWNFDSKSNLWCSPIATTHIEHLWAEVRAVRPNVIIALGGLALRVLTGEGPITSWRGSVLAALDAKKVVPTLHPAAIVRMWSYRAVAVEDLRRANKESETPEIFEPAYKFSVRPNFTQALEELEALYVKAASGAHISCDIETRGGQIACIGFAWSALEALCIPLMCVERPEGYWALDEEIEITRLIIKIMTCPNIRLSGQNFLYDAQYTAKQWAVAPPIWHDTMVIQHVLFPDLPPTLKPKSLGFLATFYCAHPRFWKDEGKLWQVEKMPEDQLWTYNCKDAVVTWEVAEAQAAILPKMKLVGPAAFQMKLWYPLLRMMLRGIAQDLELREQFTTIAQVYFDSLQEELNILVGHRLNVRSPVQLKRLFYEDLKQKRIYNRKTKSATLDDDALEKIAMREPLLSGLIYRIQLLRSAGVFKATFLETPLDTDQRMRCLFNLARAKTFRLSSSENAFGTGGNLQNLPDERDSKGHERPKELPNVRRLFIPDPGYSIANIDLKGADAQIVAAEANERGDPTLLEMFESGVDVHSENAKVLGLTRQEAKMFVHATDYYASARTLAEKLSKTVHQMEKAQVRWFSAHPGVRRWHTDVAKACPKASNAFSYRIFFFDRPDTVLTKALAWIPQSTIAILINKGLVAVHDNLPEAELLLQVHDSIVFQAKNETFDQTVVAAAKLLLIPIPYSKPLIIPVEVKVSSESWGACKEIAA